MARRLGGEGNARSRVRPILVEVTMLKTLTFATILFLSSPVVFAGSSTGHIGPSSGHGAGHSGGVGASHSTHRMNNPGKR